MTTASPRKLVYTHYGEFSPEYTDFLSKHDLSGMETLAKLTPAEARIAMGALELSTTPPWTAIKTEEHTFKSSDGSDLSARVWRKESSGNEALTAPLAIIMHGGGWVYGGHDSEPALVRVLVERFGCVGITFDYRLAPEHSFPIPFDDAYQGMKWAIEKASELGADPHNVFLTGSSAGGNLAAALALKAKEDNIEGIVGQILLIPATCYYGLFPVDKYELASYEQFSGTPLLSTEMMKSMWDAYNPDKSDSHYISPLLAPDHSGLPPAYIQIAGADPLRDEGLAYAQCLKDSGVPVKLDIYAGLPHGYQTDLLGMTSRHKCTEDIASGFEWLKSQR